MTNQSGALQILSFTAEDQVAVKELILEGLAERWGRVDPALNSDVEDIAGSYAAGTTLVARRANKVVGTGTIVPRELHVEEVVRLSVAPSARRSGIATRLLGHLIEAASARGAHRIICETSAHWKSAVRLYLNFGFTITHYRDGQFGRDAHFALDLPMAPEPD
ncbi:GNAT family N-acetyltransferase [Actinoplanes sp. CA-054009]